MSRKVLLCILDGFGISKQKNGNAIALANTPYLDHIFASSPTSQLITHGPAVGLPVGQMGNSEVGHMTIGAGRIIKQDLELIEDFFNYRLHESEIIKSLIHHHKKQGAIHIIAMISDGGIHSHIDHLIKFINYLAPFGVKLKLHLITDGRDCPPISAQKFIDPVKELTLQYPNAEIATIAGRYWAMDRDNRQERTNQYLTALQGKGESSSLDAQLVENYQNNITDEFFPPKKMNNYLGFQEQDSLIMLNFRADRVRQISKAIFNNFAPEKFFLKISLNEQIDSHFTSLIKRLPAKNFLGDILAQLGMKQLRAGETEKYPHVTYFFNGGIEAALPGEARLLIHSPKVSTYDQAPQMAAFELTNKLIDHVKSNKYDFILVNFANADMVGHTGNLQATIKAIETIDICLEKLLTIATGNNYVSIITADHGNAESMLEDNLPITSHTKNPVPLVIINYNAVKLNNGTLADIAPTILHIMGIEKPKEMTGHNLINDNF